MENVEATGFLDMDREEWAEMLRQEEERILEGTDEQIRVNREEREREFGAKIKLITKKGKI